MSTRYVWSKYDYTEGAVRNTVSYERDKVASLIVCTERPVVSGSGFAASSEESACGTIIVGSQYGGSKWPYFLDADGDYYIENPTKTLRYMLAVKAVRLSGETSVTNTMFRFDSDEYLLDEVPAVTGWLDFYKWTFGPIRGDTDYGYVASASDDSYASDGVTGDYYYVLQGSDSIDPTALSYGSAKLRGGEAVTLTATPRSNTYGGTVYYKYQYSADGGSWTTISTTSGTSVSVTVPKGAETFQARVLASDSYGFTSTDYVYAASMSVTNNSAPEAPGSITVPETVKGGKTLAVSWAASTDTDGNLSGYCLERSVNGGSWAQVYQSSGTSYTDTITWGWSSVAYRVRAYDTDGAYSGYTTSATRTVTNNSAPSAPASITVPASPQSELDAAISWTASTDPDGDAVSYELSRQLDSGDWTVLYNGTALNYTDNIPRGTDTVAYRVRAYDPDEAYSDYTTSSARSVSNDSAPVITCSLSGNLGTKDAGFTVPYVVTDAEGGTVTVQEYVGSMLKRSYTATLGETANFNVEDEDGDYFFTRILNGTQTLKIIATDAESKSAELDLTFTKAVYSLSVTLKEPLTTADDITVAIMSLASSIPSTATVELLATNNALDGSPVWQDVYADVLAGQNIVFDNTTQANGPAFNFKLSVSRADGGTGGYVSTLAGAFQ